MRENQTCDSILCWSYLLYTQRNHTQSVSSITIPNSYLRTRKIIITEFFMSQSMRRYQYYLWRLICDLMVKNFVYWRSVRGTKKCVCAIIDYWNQMCNLSLKSQKNQSENNLFYFICYFLFNSVYYLLIL